MKIISWNVNGLRAVMKKNFTEFLEIYNPDVLCLQEVRTPEKELEKIDLPFVYKKFSCAEKAGYSGTAILSKVAPLKMYEVQLENHPVEGRITAAEFESFTLFSIYVPNAQDDLRRLDYRQNNWDKDLRNFLHQESKKKPIIICGDLNVAHTEIDLARPKQNTMNAGFTTEEREGMSLMLEEVPLCDIWRARNPDVKDKYTWWSFRGGARSRNVGWRIDYFLISSELEKAIDSVDILDEVKGSDHCPIVLAI